MPYKELVELVKRIESLLLEKHGPSSLDKHRPEAAIDNKLLARMRDTHAAHIKALQRAGTIEVATGQNTRPQTSLLRP